MSKYNKKNKLANNCLNKVFSLTKVKGEIKIKKDEKNNEFINEKLRLEKVQKSKYETNKKLRDEIVFSINMFLTYVAIAIISAKPNWYPKFNSFIIPIMLVHRVYEYLFYKWHFYLIDFCYVVNFCVIFYTEFFQDNFNLFLASFGFSCGFTLYAVFFYKYGFIFHNTVKMTSLWTHFSPAITMLIFRWQNEEIFNKSHEFLYGATKFNNFSNYFSIKEIDNLNVWNPLIILNSLDVWNIFQIKFSCYIEYLKSCSFVYFPWFIIYYLINFQICFKYILKNNYESQFTHFLNKKDRRLVKFGKFGQGLIYMIFHLLYIILLSTGSFLLLYSKNLGILAIIICLISLIKQSSTYYIEYFSDRYHLQFLQKEKFEKKNPI